jgi:hypothetical protein
MLDRPRCPQRMRARMLAEMLPRLHHQQLRQHSAPSTVRAISVHAALGYSGTAEPGRTAVRHREAQPKV